MQYDKIQQVSEDTVLASHLASQKGVKMPQMPETVIYPFGLNQSQKLAVEKVFPSKSVSFRILRVLERHRQF